MSRHLGLRSRIRRLERQGKAKRPRRPVLFKLFDEPDDRVTGIDGINAPIAERRWGEALDSLVSRARAGTGPRQVLLCRYPRPEPEPAPVAAPGGPVAPPPPAPTFDRHAPDAAKRWRAFAEGIEQ